jgi:hypothetical protein
MHWNRFRRGQSNWQAYRVAENRLPLIRETYRKIAYCRGIVPCIVLEDLTDKAVTVHTSVAQIGAALRSTKAVLDRPYPKAVRKVGAYNIE